MNYKGSDGAVTVDIFKRIAGKLQKNPLRKMSKKLVIEIRLKNLRRSIIEISKEITRNPTK